MKSAAIKKALRQLNKLGGETRHLDSVVSYWRTDFPVEPGADYAFIVNIYADGGASLSAKRNGSPDSEYFWGLSYDTDGYTNETQMLNSLVEDVTKVLENRTRVRQQKGLLSFTFSCEVHHAGDWQSLGAQQAFRFGGFSFPPAKQKITDYESPARGVTDATRATGSAKGDT